MVGTRWALASSMEEREDIWGFAQLWEGGLRVNAAPNLAQAPESEPTSLLLLFPQEARLLDPVREGRKQAQKSKRQREALLSARGLGPCRHQSGYPGPDPDAGWPHLAGDYVSVQSTPGDVLS